MISHRGKEGAHTMKAKPVTEVFNLISIVEYVSNFKKMYPSSRKTRCKPGWRRHTEKINALRRCFRQSE